MANISMDLVKELREKTQVGMMDCKKALVETEGNIEKAVELLRKKGAAVAAKRADNAMDNGRVESFVSDDFKAGAIAEIGCETDFSANTDDMKEFAEQAAKDAVEHGIEDAAALLEKSSNLSTTLDELLAKISEKIQINKTAVFKVEGNGIVNAYIHPGSTVGVLVMLDSDGSSDTAKLAECARNICMHIAVTRPLCVSPEALNPEVLEKEQAIMIEQLKNSGKPDNIIEKIMVGKTAKYYEEVCLNKQSYIKDDSMSIEEYAKSCGASVNTFARFGIGGK